MDDVPSLDRWDYAAAGSVVVLLVLGYVVVPAPVVQYGVWLAIFCIWMAWFFFFGSKWLYEVEV